MYLGMGLCHLVCKVPLGGVIKAGFLSSKPISQQLLSVLS